MDNYNWEKRCKLLQIACDECRDLAKLLGCEEDAEYLAEEMAESLRKILTRADALGIEPEPEDEDEDEDEDEECHGQYRSICDQAGREPGTDTDTCLQHSPLDDMPF